MKSSILIVDDEPDITRLIAWNLQQAGHQTAVVHTAHDALDAIDRSIPDLVILDLMLPDLSGTEVCRRLKQNPSTRALPVVMVTARDTEFDRVVGFELGADDYVLKPFSVRELVLRIEAVLRRVQPQENAATLEYAEIAVNFTSHRVEVEGEEIHLTRSEFDLLATILKGSGKVFTREELLDKVWGMQAEVLDRTVDVHIMRLRKKLGEAGGHIETVRGVGYRAA